MKILDTPAGVTFGGFYYPEILRDVLAFLRAHKDETGLSDENEHEVHVRLAQAFALVGHLCSVRLDAVASELLVDSAQTLEGVKRLLRLIGVRLASAKPATADLLLKLSAATVADATGFVPALSRFGTATIPPIVYEALTAQDLNRTDRVRHVVATEQQATGGTGSTDVGNPDVLTRGSGSWPTDVVGMQIEISGSLLGATGEYRVVQRVSDTQVKLVQIPSDEAPALRTETALTWYLRKYTTDQAAHAYTPADSFAPWTAPQPGDALYIGHPRMMPTRLDVSLATPAVGLAGVWEYYDGELSAFAPTSVTSGGGTLTFDLTPLLGAARADGAEVTVAYLRTGASEVRRSFWASGKNQCQTTGYLGQTSPSTTASDYSVSAKWAPFPGLTDTTAALTADGAASWTLPHDQTRAWRRTQVAQTWAYWARLRLVVVGAGLPTIEDIECDQGDQYLVVTVTQGETQSAHVLGGSTGRPDQVFALPETPFLDDSETIEVDEAGVGDWTVWRRTEALQDSDAQSRHYMLDTDADGQATIRFGDGTYGMVPPAGFSNVRATYRVGGADDGNVAVLQITGNRDGINGVSEVTNPRAATGWVARAGSTDADLTRIKRDGPSGTRTRASAVQEDDIERFATTKFRDAAGRYAVARAWAEEERNGPKTCGLIVVGQGGAPLTASQLTSLEVYFNGDPTASPQTRGVLTLNSRVVAVNAQLSPITVAATVVWPQGSVESVRAAIIAHLSPLALDADGTSWLHQVGGLVSLGRVYAAIHAVDPSLRHVRTLTLNGSAASVQLAAGELPTTRTALVTVVVVES